MYIKIIAPPKYYHPEDIQFMQFFVNYFYAISIQYSLLSNTITKVNVRKDNNNTKIK